MSTAACGAPARETAPARPIAATIAVVIRESRVLLIRRANPPDIGRWGFPGGKIEMGETVEACALRELREETGIAGQALRVLTAVDAFDRASERELRQHFVLVAVLCRWLEGEPVAGDDALEAAWFEFEALEDADLVLSLDVARVALLARSVLKESAR